MAEQHPFSEAGHVGLRSATDIASRGRPWADVSDDYLIGFVSEIQHGLSHTPAVVEMQRRVTVAQRESNAIQQRLIQAIEAGSDCASQQTTEVINLTRALKVYTVVLIAIGIVQIALMFWKR